MRNTIGLIVAVTVASNICGAALAQGHVAGAAVGAVVAPKKHRVAGAVVGAAVGHHMAKTKAKKMAVKHP